MSSLQEQREAELSHRRFCLAAAANLVRTGSRQEISSFLFLDDTKSILYQV